MPGATYCPIHQVRFRESGVQFRNISYKLFPATYALNHFPEPEPENGNMYEAEFIRLAEDINWLLNKGFSFSDSEWIEHSFVELTGKPIRNCLPTTKTDGTNCDKHFEDYLVSRMIRENGTQHLQTSVWQQIGTIVCIEKSFGTVEQFFLS